MNREEYLLTAVKELSKLFELQGYKLPAVNVSCSWPGGKSNHKQTIGQCWPKSCSKAGINEIFISPSIEDSVRCLDILTHELIHAIDDCQHGHRKEFTAIMRAIGLEGKPTVPTAGERLHAELSEIVSRIGEYPHKRLTAPVGSKQKNRQLKVTCFQCEAVWRMANKWREVCTQCPCCGDTDIVFE